MITSGKMSLSRDTLFSPKTRLAKPTVKKTKYRTV